MIHQLDPTEFDQDEPIHDLGNGIRPLFSHDYDTLSVSERYHSFVESHWQQLKISQDLLRGNISKIIRHWLFENYRNNF